MEVLQTNHTILMRLTTQTATVEEEWLRELLMDLSMVDKLVLAILMNSEN